MNTRTGEAQMLDVLHENGYKNITLLPTGEWAATLKMVYTTGLFIGLTEAGYRTRFCYEAEQAATEALKNWDGKDFPPGFWIKQKPEGYMNPALAKKVPE